MIPTPHIQANEKDIAETVIMPGDPLRAKYIAENFLADVVCFNYVRNMLGFTGEYNGKRVSVMGSGMGMPSMGIYSYELFNFYGVKNIIRIGSAGAINSNIDIMDIVIAMGACTNSNYGAQFDLDGCFAPIASYKLLKSAEQYAVANKMKFNVGNVVSNDTFYDDNNKSLRKWDKMGVLAVEMETAALYMNAARAGKNALCILTVSDCPFKDTCISSKERETGFNDMVKMALNII